MGWELVGLTGLVLTVSTAFAMQVTQRMWIGRLYLIGLVLMLLGMLGLALEMGFK